MKKPPKTGQSLGPLCVAMPGVCHYNAHAICRPAWKHLDHERHTPPDNDGRGVFSAGGIGYSVLLGSLICVIPNAFLALRLVVPRRDPGAQALVNAAWIGEIGKLALTVLLFSLVFTLVRPLNAAALFAGFIASQLVTFSGFLMRGDTLKDTERQNGS